jgi:hypothetical protein
MQIKWITVALMLSTAAPPVLAEEPIYLYGDVEYITLDPDVGSSLDGFGLSGSHPVGEDFHVMALYSRVDNNNLRLNDFGAALGHHRRIAYRTDLVGRVGMVRARVNPTGATSVSENALLLQLGLRGMVNWNLELSGFVTHRDLDDSDTRLDLGGVLHVNEQLGVTADVSFGSDDTTLRIGARFMMP